MDLKYRCVAVFPLPCDSSLVSEWTKRNISRGLSCDIMKMDLFHFCKLVRNNAESVFQPISTKTCTECVCVCCIIDGSNV